jgi:hypothetical protein
MSADVVIVPDDADMTAVSEAAPTAETIPALLTVATAGLADSHSTFCVMLFVVLFENMPSASSWRFVPGAIPGFEGVICNETRAADGAGVKVSSVSGLQPEINKGRNTKAAIVTSPFFMVVVSWW